MNINRWRWTFWLFAGVTLVGLAGWQIAQITVGQYGLLNPPKPKLPPTKLRSDGRVALAKEMVSSDPVGTYLDRSKLGMTDREIGWMIDDYQQLALEQLGPNGKSFNPHSRARQQYWYLLALTEGLSLNPEQRAQAGAKMRELLQTDLDAFKQGIAGVSDLGDENAKIPDDMPVAPFSPPEVWLAKDHYQPWNLSSLSTDQGKLTLKAWRTGPDAAGGNGTRFPTIQDPQTGNLIEFPESNSAATNTFQYLAGSGFFPLTPNQIKLSEHLGDPLAQARLSHPAQLRMALLLQPTLAAGLLRQLDAPLAPGVVQELPLTPEQPPVVTEPELPSE